MPSSAAHAEIRRSDFFFSCGIIVGVETIFPTRSMTLLNEARRRASAYSSVGDGYLRLKLELESRVGQLGAHVLDDVKAVGEVFRRLCRIRYQVCDRGLPGDGQSVEGNDRHT